MVPIITGYRVQKKKRGRDWEDVNSFPVQGESMTVPDLDEGDEYEFRVAAVTDAGVGDQSMATAPVKVEEKKSKSDSFVVADTHFQLQPCVLLISRRSLIVVQPLKAKTLSLISKWMASPCRKSNGLKMALKSDHRPSSGSRMMVTKSNWLSRMLTMEMLVKSLVNFPTLKERRLRL